MSLEPTVHCMKEEGPRLDQGPQKGHPEGQLPYSAGAITQRPADSEPRALGVKEGHKGRVSKANTSTADEAGSRGGSRAEEGGGLFTQQGRPGPRGEGGSGPGLSIPWAQV